MFDFLHGQLAAKTPATATLQVGGVGYLLRIPLSTYAALPRTGRQVRLLTHLHVREDELSIYGFGTELEREFFRMLIGVSRIGPALALQILGACPPERFKRCILDEDVDTLKTGVKGIGEKTARRLIVELRESVEGLAVGPELASATSAARDAVQALVALGEPRSAAQKAVEAALKRLGPEADCQQIVQAALAP